MMKNGSPIVLSCLLALLLVSSCSTVPERPNIVFIMADDMGHSDPECYGAEILDSSHIDALAEDRKLL
jgi:hypothetical protein